MDLKDIEAYKKEMLKLYNKGKPAVQAEKYAGITEAEELMAEEFTAAKENNVPAEYQLKNSASYSEISEAEEKMATEFTAAKENKIPAEYQLKNSASYSEISEAEEKMAEEFTAAKENNVPAEYQQRGQSKSENNEEYDDKDYDDAEHDSAYYPYTADEEEAELERIINSTQLPEFELPIEPQTVSEAGLGDSTGFILVNVRTGRDATPVVGASVVVTAVNNGSRLLAAAGITDISGTVLRFEVPAPDKAYSQTPDTDVRPYSLFDISVRAKGFFNARSIDVPVFSGITSVQNFNMVPLPIAADSDEDTLTYFNQEPF